MMVFNLISYIRARQFSINNYIVMSTDSSSSSSSGSDEEIIEGRSSTAAQEVAKNKVLTTPAVRRLASENKVDLSQVKATGPHGRILKGDVLAYLSGEQDSLISNKPAVVDVRPKQPLPPPAADRVEVLKGVRKIMFKSMTNSLV